jgi:hypothetical protein
VGFEPTIPVFEQAKTVHALDREATVTGVRVVKSRMVKSEHLILIKNKEIFTKFWLESLKRRNNAEDLGIYGRGMLIWTGP